MSFFTLFNAAILTIWRRNILVDFLPNVNKDPVKPTGKIILSQSAIIMILQWGQMSHKWVLLLNVQIYTTLLISTPSWFQKWHGAFFTWHEQEVQSINIIHNSAANVCHAPTTSGFYYFAKNSFNTSLLVQIQCTKIHSKTAHFCFMLWYITYALVH